MVDQEVCQECKAEGGGKKCAKCGTYECIPASDGSSRCILPRKGCLICMCQKCKTEGGGRKCANCGTQLCRPLEDGECTTNKSCFMCRFFPAEVTLSNCRRGATVG